MPHDSFGFDVRACAVNGIRVTETVMPAGLQLAEHAHETGQICFVLEGAYDEDSNTGSRHLRAGMMLVRAPGEPHSNSFPRDAGALTLLLSIDARRWVPSATGVPRRAFDSLVTDLRAELRRGDLASNTALEGLSLLAMARVARMPDAPAEPAWLTAAESLIESRYAGPLALSDLVDAIGVRRTTLAAGFRRYRERTVGDAIRAVRVRRAGEALRLTNIPLAEIAQRCGFHDQAHFTRVFRDMTGETPAAYRSKSSK
jgi:AraC family transcriptional regulator